MKTHTYPIFFSTLIVLLTAVFSTSQVYGQTSPNFKITYEKTEGKVMVRQAINADGNWKAGSNRPYIRIDLNSNKINGKLINDLNSIEIVISVEIPEELSNRGVAFDKWSRYNPVPEGFKSPIKTSKGRYHSLTYKIDLFKLKASGKKGIRKEMVKADFYIKYKGTSYGRNGSIGTDAYQIRGLNYSLYNIDKIVRPSPKPHEDNNSTDNDPGNTPTPPLGSIVDWDVTLMLVKNKNPKEAHIIYLTYFKESSGNDPHRKDALAKMIEIFEQEFNKCASKSQLAKFKIDFPEKNRRITNWYLDKELDKNFCKRYPQLCRKNPGSQATIDPQKRFEKAERTDTEVAYQFCINDFIANGISKNNKWFKRAEFAYKGIKTKDQKAFDKLKIALSTNNCVDLKTYFAFEPKRHFTRGRTQKYKDIITHTRCPDSWTIAISSIESGIIEVVMNNLPPDFNPEKVKVDYSFGMDSFVAKSKEFNKDKRILSWEVQEVDQGNKIIEVAYGDRREIKNILMPKRSYEVILEESSLNPISVRIRGGVAPFTLLLLDEYGEIIEKGKMLGARIEKINQSESLRKVAVVDQAGRRIERSIKMGVAAPNLWPIYLLSFSIVVILGILLSKMLIFKTKNS